MPNLKKLGLSILGIVAVAAIYYFTSGSQQLTLKMKEQIDAEIATLQTQGFSIEGREVSETKEHFVLSFNDTKKIAKLLNENGAQINAEDAEVLKGLKVGVDIAYLEDVYSSATFDIYPLALPTLVTTASYDKEEKALLSQVEKMLEKKTFLVHISINKLGTGFKGYMKDINEVLTAEKNVTLTLKDLKFNGDLKNNKTSSVTQTLSEIRMQVEDDLEMHLNGLTSHYTLTGKTNYDYTTDYTMDNVSIAAPSEFTLALEKTTVTSKSSTKDGLVSVSMTSASKNFTLDSDGEKLKLKRIAFDMNIDNLDIKAIQGLEQANSKNEKEMNALLQQLISKSVRLEIPTFSVENIIYNDQELNNFAITADMDIDKSLNLTTLEQNPMAAIDAINANLNMTLSSELFGILSQQPQAMMAMMLFQPKDVNGKKVYKVELKDGKLLVNDQPVM